MIKLNKQVENLKNVLLKIEKKCEEIQAKMDAIEEKAGEMDRDLTTSEQNRFDKYEEEYAELKFEYDEVKKVIDYLDEYCEW